MTLLVSIAVLLAFLFLYLVVVYAARIAHGLESIGAREPSVSNRGGEARSYLSRIWFGVRAIEAQLASLGPQAKRLNRNLTHLVQGLSVLEQGLKGTLEAVERQGRR